MNNISRDINRATFNTGSRVEEDGFYVCVPCGYKKYLKKGEQFPRCMKCLKEEEREFLTGMELWEKVTK